MTTPNAAQIAKVSLIRSPSVTHALDMNQRFQFLNFTAGAGKLTVQAPANANLAPPGDYMLFVVDTNGVPSVALVHPQTPAPRPTGHDAADRLDHGARERRDDLRARTRHHRERVRQRRGRRRAVQDRRSEPRRRGHDAPYSLSWDSTHGDERVPHAHRGRARRDRQRRRPPTAVASDGVEPAPPPVSSPRTASTRAAARPPPTSPAAATTARSSNATWAARAGRYRERAVLQRHERVGDRSGLERRSI